MFLTGWQSCRSVETVVERCTAMERWCNDIGVVVFVFVNRCWETVFDTIMRFQDVFEALSCD